MLQPSGAGLERAAEAIRVFLEGLGSLVFPATSRELPSRQGARGLAAPRSQHSVVGDVGEVLLTGAALALALITLALAATWLLAARVPNDPKAVFFAIFEDRIRSGFPGQSVEAMSTVLTGVNSVLRPTPESPCVLLFLSGPGAEDVALRLARAVAEAVQVALRVWPPPTFTFSSSEDVEVLGGEFSSHDDYWRLYETLSRRLEDERVVVVRDLQHVHPRTAAAISHLCDDTYPPFPQSVLILLLSPGAHIYPQDDGKLARGAGQAVVTAEHCLVQCWLARAPPPSSGAPPPSWSSRDALPGVLARLTGRAVLVLPDGSATPAAPAENSPPPDVPGGGARPGLVRQQVQ